MFFTNEKNCKLKKNLHLDFDAGLNLVYSVGSIYSFVTVSFEIGEIISLTGGI